MIYLLVDPRDRTIRYAGVTNDLARRLSEHLQASQANPRMRQWITELGALAMTPEMLPVEWPGKNWPRAERAWIAWLRSHGGDTYNIAAGGLPWWQAVKPMRTQNRAGTSARRKFDNLAKRNHYQETGKVRALPGTIAPTLIASGTRSYIDPKTGVYKRFKRGQSSRVSQPVPKHQIPSGPLLHGGYTFASLSTINRSQQAENRRIALELGTKKLEQQGKHTQTDRHPAQGLAGGGAEQDHSDDQEQDND